MINQAAPASWIVSSSTSSINEINNTVAPVVTAPATPAPTPPPPPLPPPLPPPPPPLQQPTAVPLTNVITIATTNLTKTRDNSETKTSTTAANTPQMNDHHHAASSSSSSMFERIRQFLYINFLLNKYSFVLSILSYLADLILFVSLNLYLFSNIKFLYEITCANAPLPPLSIMTTSASSDLISQSMNETLPQSSSQQLAHINTTLHSSPFTQTHLYSMLTRSIKQSYLTLQIVVIFVFFICFILSYLIKLQFKYHRLALNLYDYDVEATTHQFNTTTTNIDHDGIDSIASSTTGSHFSSSAITKKLTTLLKRLLNRLLTKLASILLFFVYGYQFCQNCFIQNSAEIATNGYYVFIHVFILCAVVFRSFVSILSKRNSMNQLNYLKKLQEKHNTEPAAAAAAATVASANATKDYYYHYYYRYVIKYNQSAFNQLKQHQYNQNKFKVIQLNELALFLGFIFALFHLFSLTNAIELTFLFVNILLTLVLVRLKSILNACLNLALLIFTVLFISSFRTSALDTDWLINETRSTMSECAVSASNVTTSYVNSAYNVSAIVSLVDKLGASTVANVAGINLFSYNLLTFVSFLLTVYLKSIVSIYYCTLTCLERWNLSFLSRLAPGWKKLSIYATVLVYLTFVAACAIFLCLELKQSTWVKFFIVLVLYVIMALVWFSFQLLNAFNLLNLMNKINDCFLLLNETNSNSNVNSLSIENASNVSRKSRSSHHRHHHHHHHHHHNYSKMNRNSTLSQGSNVNAASSSTANSKSTNSNPNSNANNNNNNNTSSGASGTGSRRRFNFRKWVSRFLNYHKLNVRDEDDYDDEDEYDYDYDNGGDSCDHASSGNLYTCSNVPIHRILNYKGVRHLGSISYRISLYCFVQTLLLAPFVFSTRSTFTMGAYLLSVSLSFIWLSLLYQFPKSRSGSCVAYALVAPPLILNIYNAGTWNKSGGGTMSSNPATLPPAPNGTKKSRSTMNSASTGTTTTSSYTTGTTTTTTTTTTSNSLLFLPFNYQQALTQRCTFILNKIQLFLQFHLIENYGCDFAQTGLSKELLEQKLRSFFGKRGNDGSYFNTYLLYYCGPTSPLTDSLSFIDGNEFSIEQIVDIWKMIHCPSGKKSGSGGETTSDEEQPSPPPPQAPTCDEVKHSRLIIILDAENTNKSLEYVKSKLVDKNVYVALQTAKYNYNYTEKPTPASNIIKANTADNKLLKPAAAKSRLMGPGSPQTMTSGSFFDSYLNIGKFTLDWIKSNSNAVNLHSYDPNAANELENTNTHLENYFLTTNLNDYEKQQRRLLEEEDEEDEDDADHSPDDDDDDEEDPDDDSTSDYEPTDLANNPHSIFNNNHVNNNNNNNNNPTSGGLVAKKTKKNSDSSPFFYEAKCAFSRYWNDYSFDANDKTLARDFIQFWNLYYPCIVCKPLLKLINCRIFYLRFNFLRRVMFLLKRFKDHIVPVHEFETGHGFKLFSS